MILYRIEVTPAAQKQLSKLPAKEKLAIAKIIDALGEDPRPSNVKKMQGFDHLYRIRSGDYRIIYKVEDNIILITIIKIGHRKDIYRFL